MKWFAVIAITTVISACYNLEPLRKSAPIDAFVLYGDYHDIAACLPQRLRPARANNVVVQQHDGSMSVILVSPAGVISYLWEVTFTPASEETTLVEIRSHYSLWGPFADDELINAIHMCGES